MTGTLIVFTQPRPLVNQKVRLHHHRCRAIVIQSGQRTITSVAFRGGAAW